MKHEFEGYEGYVELKTVTFEDKLELGETVLFESLNIKSDHPNAGALSNAKAIRMLLPKMKEMIVEVNLTRKSDSKAFKTYNELNQDSDAHDVISTLCGRFMAQFVAGNSIDPS